MTQGTFFRLNSKYQNPRLDRRCSCFQKAVWLPEPEGTLNLLDSSFGTAGDQWAQLQFGGVWEKSHPLVVGTASSKVLHFHLTFQKQDGGRRKGGRFILHNNWVDQAAIQEETALKTISSWQLVAPLPWDPNCHAKDGTLAERSSPACWIGPQFRTARATLSKSREHGVQKSPADFLGLGTWGVGSLFTVLLTHFIQQVFSAAASHIIFHSAWL